jgi:hypothetical protein
MEAYPEPYDFKRLKVQPLARRRSMSRLEEVLVEPSDAPPACPAPLRRQIEECARAIRAARARGATVLLMYGAHPIKNGGQLLLNQMLDRGLVTHLATNGAGTIHDWEFSYQGLSTESVRDNVATGTFGAWDETGRCFQLALLAGGLRGEGFGRSLGRLIQEDGVKLPSVDELRQWLRHEPEHPLSPARADLMQTMLHHQVKGGHQILIHRFRNASVLGHAYRQNVPFTVHPGIGYDIITNHPWFNGAVVGRAAGVDFGLIWRAIDGLDGGVTLSIGSAIMAPQVYEKAVNCANNLRLQEGRPILTDHSIHIVDLQDGGNWDWTAGEPPKDNPAYYLRFCKSFSRMGGRMHYCQSDNVVFLHHLLHCLSHP